MTQKNLVILTLAALMAWTASIQPAGAFGQNKINYQVFDWKVYHAPHFDIYYYTEEEDFVEQMVRYAESAYLQLSKDLDHEVKVRIPLIFFQNHTEFEQNNIIMSFIPEAVGAFAEPIENRMVLPIDLPPEALYGLVVHELTHIFWYSVLFDGKLSRSFRANPPLWLAEGLAEHMAARRDSLNKMVLRDAGVNNIIPPITRVNSLSFLTYRFGEAAFEFIEKEWGEEGVRNLLFEYRIFRGTKPLYQRLMKTAVSAIKTDPRAYLLFRKSMQLPVLRELRARFGRST